MLSPKPARSPSDQQALSLPLVRLPQRVVYVDDDNAFLEMLRVATPRSIAREFVSSPSMASVSLRREGAYWRAIEEALTSGSEARDQGHGEAAHFVRSYFQDWRRLRVTSVIVVDYAMPQMGGLELIHSLSSTPARRLLLTGQADAGVAVAAFNAGSIHRFVEKSARDTLGEIGLACDELHEQVCDGLGAVTRANLNLQQMALLQHPAVAPALRRRFHELGWIEYVAVGQPLGFLGMTKDGPLQWLQLETAESLAALVETMGDAGVDAASLQKIARGDSIACGELLMQLDLPWTGEVVPAVQLCEAPRVVSAVIDLPVDVLTASEYGIDDILSEAEFMRRLVRDVELSMGPPKASSRPELLQDAVAHFAAAAAAAPNYLTAGKAVLREHWVPEAVRIQLEGSLDARGERGP